MAEVYKKVNGMKIPKLIAHQEDVQQELTDVAGESATKAEWLLAGHRDAGHARILVEVGDVDRHIILDDSRGLDAAMSIEYGRKPFNKKGRPQAPMHGTFVLHDATGLPR